MERCAFQADHGYARIAHELVDYVLAVVFLAIAECGKSANREDIEILTQHGCRLLHVLRRRTVHYSTIREFELPPFLVDVEDNDLHAQVSRGHLRAYARAEAGIEKYHAERLARSQLTIAKRILLIRQCFAHQRRRIRHIFNGQEMFHSLGVWSHMDETHELCISTTCISIAISFQLFTQCRNKH